MKYLLVFIVFVAYTFVAETLAQKVVADNQGNIRLSETSETSIRTIQNEINMLVERRDDPKTDIGDRLSLQARIDDLAEQRAAMFSGMIPKVEVVPKKEYDALQAEVVRLQQVEVQHMEEHMDEDDYQRGKEYNPSYGSTVARIKERDFLICGVYDNAPGFSERNGHYADEGVWRGFDVDICRAFAVALLGDKSKIKFKIVNGRTRFDRLVDGTVDIISATTTWTYTRDVIHGIEFLPTTFYDGQGFIVRKTLGAKSAKDLARAVVCFNIETTAEQNVKDFFELYGMEFTPAPVYPDEDIVELYLDGNCDMYGVDRSALAGDRSQFPEPEKHVILPEIISKEPLGPAVRYGDQLWSDITRWTVYTLFIAEELSITSKNIDMFKENIDPKIQRFMGERDGEEFPHLGAKLGLAGDWTYQIVKQIGNYKELYDKYLGTETPLNLKRGYNKLYTDGGLLYAPPLR